MLCSWQGCLGTAPAWMFHRASRNWEQIVWPETTQRQRNILKLRVILAVGRNEAGGRLASRQPVCSWAACQRTAGRTARAAQPARVDCCSWTVEIWPDNRIIMESSVERLGWPGLRRCRVTLLTLTISRSVCTPHYGYFVKTCLGSQDRFCTAVIKCWWAGAVLLWTLQQCRHGDSVVVRRGAFGISSRARPTSRMTLRTSLMKLFLFVISVIHPDNVYNLTYSKWRKFGNINIVNKSFFVRTLWYLHDITTDGPEHRTSEGKLLCSGQGLSILEDWPYVATEPQRTSTFPLTAERHLHLVIQSATSKTSIML